MIEQGEHDSGSEAETISLARKLGSALPEGSWILLMGPLGAGKTAFVRGLAEGLGIDPRLVHSPTFTLVSEYKGERTLAHVDLYRIEKDAELDELGLEDLLERDLIVAVEWGERLPPGWVDRPYQVRIDVLSPDQRRITIRC
jgi:tRNA threonylcarbamoyladenosine biosynthesis protein TsaE